MRPAGDEPLARWRETGEWWANEPQREITQKLDEQGIRREIVVETRPISRSKLTTEELKEKLAPDTNNKEEWNLRIHKRRDEKVAQACGTLPAEPAAPTHLDKGKSIPYAPLQVWSGYSFGRGTMLAEEIPILCGGAGIPAAAICDFFSLSGAVEFAKRAKAAGVKPLIGATLELECGARIALIAKSKIGYEQLSQLLTECHLGEPRQFPLCNWNRLERWSRDLICLTGGDSGPLNRAIAHRDYELAETQLDRLVNIYGSSNVAVQIERSYLPWEISVNRQLLELAESKGVLPVAGGLVTHARLEHFPVQDILVCADTLCLVDEIVGRKDRRHNDQHQLINLRPERALNGERYLRTPSEMAELFADRPDLLENTLRLADRCEDDVLPQRTRLPQLYSDPAHVLREAAYVGAHQRHGKLSTALRKQLELELERIIRLNFSEHFLIAFEMCAWAREQGILFSGRGSVVDAAISYCLGFSRIDAFQHNLHFDRFLPDDGTKRPDIDIDFEAHRREDVRIYLTERFGVQNVATVAAVGTYCTRGIIREVGKAMGLPPDVIGYLAKRMHGGVTPEKLESSLIHRPELAGANVPKERFRWVFELAERMQDLPRNIRSHSSGVVISSRPLAETVPVMWSATEIDLEGDYFNSPLPLGRGQGVGLLGAGSGSGLPHSPVRCAHRPSPQGERNGFSPTLGEGIKGWGDPESCANHKEKTNLRIIQWDKRSAKYYFDKFDILCLRGQDVLSGAESRIKISNSEMDVERIPLDDDETYRAMRSGELIGIPQSASPAMRQAHIRVRTANLHDASLVQAGIRPGVGGAVKINELIARRRGKPFTFEHPDLEEILGLTYGILVFQEQVDQLLQKFAAYSSGEAEDTRESIHKYRREDFGESIKDQVISRIRANGYDEATAEAVFRLVSEFKGYGFAQGHALAFAEISIRCIYLQQNFPAPYFASLLDAQPAGYYGPCTLVNEARSRGVAILPPSVNQSTLRFEVEDVLSALDPKITLPEGGVRVSLSQVSGVSKQALERLMRARSDRLFTSFFDFVARVRPERDELERLILCGAFDDLCPNRRAMMWALNESRLFADLVDRRPDTLDLGFIEPEIDLSIEDFPLPEKAILEREVLDLDVHRHLVAFERDRVKSKGGLTADEIKKLPGGVKCMAVGNPIRLRFPPTPSGKRVVFFDLEDETGLLNVTCFDATYRRDGHSIVCSPYVTIVGETQDRDGHTAFLARRVFPYKPTLAGAVGDPSALPIVTGDFLFGGGNKPSRFATK